MLPVSGIVGIQFHTQPDIINDEPSIIVNTSPICRARCQPIVKAYPIHPPSLGSSSSYPLALHMGWSGTVNADARRVVSDCSNFVADFQKQGSHFC